jgi:hypothetical protein
MDERKKMINGEKPSGCQYCWNIEDMGADYISDRHEKSANIYNAERLAEIVADPYKPVNPEYIEVSFGNECNFKCGYCHPKFSSAYYKEIKDHGPYTMVKNHRNDIDYFNIFEEDKNPYENNHPKQKHFSSHSEESEVIMFRADETSMYEDKNLPVFNCYSPSKCSKFGKNK